MNLQLDPLDISHEAVTLQHHTLEHNINTIEDAANATKERHYCVVRIFADDGCPVTIISSTWLLKCGHMAAIPNVPHHTYYRLVWEHNSPRPEDKIMPIAVIARTVSFKRARLIEASLDTEPLEETVDVVPLSTLPAVTVCHSARMTSQGDDSNPTLRNSKRSGASNGVQHCMPLHPVPSPSPSPSIASTFSLKSVPSPEQRLLFLRRLDANLKLLADGAEVGSSLESKTYLTNSLATMTQSQKCASIAPSSCMKCSPTT
ncbi:unnamed protein product [Dicrocoelium dendriticum]|nr:unnamed protein product [Dicrocoelium dendriticum]